METMYSTSTPTPQFTSGAKIKVVGCGGGGGNAVNRMVHMGIQGVEFVAVNTDVQDLANNAAPVKIQIGAKCTRGLGAGGRHEVGREAAEESLREIEKEIEGCDMVFVAAGMGGGTGTGSAPVVADIAKRSGALTIGVVTSPFEFEGVTRAQNASEGLEALIPHVDTLVVVPNQKLFEVCSQSDRQLSMEQAFALADNVLCNGVKAISEIITVPGLINLDFADVRSIMSNAGPAWMSIGIGKGPKRIKDATDYALTSPLLPGSIEGAKGVMFNIVGSRDLSLQDVNEAAEEIRKRVDPDANVIFGVKVDDTMGDTVQLTLIATGFDTPEAYVEEVMEDTEAVPYTNNYTTSYTAAPAATTEATPAPTYASTYNENYVESRKTLRDMHTDTELDIPSFIRNQKSFSSRNVSNPQTYTQQNTNPYSSYGSTYSAKPAFGQRAYATRRAW